LVETPQTKRSLGTPMSAILNESTHNVATAFKAYAGRTENKGRVLL
jgi:hypothetical protein